MAYHPTTTTIEPEGRVRRYALPGGDAAVRVTLRHMVRWAREPDPLTRAVAAHMVAQAEADPLRIVRAIDTWVTQHVPYMADPEGTEQLKTPAYMMQEIERDGVSSGDCDDMATLAAALGVAAGLPARFVVLAWRRGGPYEHVLAQLWADRWRAIDPSRPARWRPPSGYIRGWVVPVLPS